MTGPRRDETGMAMLTAIMVTVVVLFLGMTSVALSDHSFNAQRVDRKRVQTFHAAEAGIDHALQVLQTTPLASLQCASPLVAALGTGPYTADYTVSFTYYATYPATGSPMTCPLSAEPETVLLRSHGDSSDPLGTRRQVELTAKLDIPLDAPAFNRSVFSDESITVNNNVTVAGYDGNDAVMYTNGNYICENSQVLAGHLYAQGTANLSNSCAVNGDLWATGAVTLANTTSVGRDVISGTASVTMSGNADVRRNARAATTVTTNNASTVHGLKIPNSPAGAAPSATFPQLPYSAAAWTAAGYTIRNYTNCTTARSDIQSLAPTWTGRTVVRITGCRLDLSNNTTIRIANDLAVISDWGVTFANRTVWQSADGAAKQLHLIVPWGSTCDAATGRGNIELHNNGDIQVPIETFIYTPCTVKVANSGVLQGQIYGDSVQFTNLTTLAYRPVNGVPGYSSASSTAMARQVSVLYKREVAA